MTKRIYCVSDGNTDRLVRAHHPSAAIKHVADGLITARVATQDDLVTLMEAGWAVEDAGQKAPAEHGSEQAEKGPEFWPQKGEEMVGDDGGPIAA